MWVLHNIFFSISSFPPVANNISACPYALSHIPSVCSEYAPVSVTLLMDFLQSSWRLPCPPEGRQEVRGKHHWEPSSPTHGRILRHSLSASMSSRELSSRCPQCGLLAHLFWLLSLFLTPLFPYRCFLHLLNTPLAPNSLTQFCPYGNLNQENASLKLIWVPNLPYPPKLGTKCIQKSMNRLLWIDQSYDIGAKPGHSGAWRGHH